MFEYTKIMKGKVVVLALTGQLDALTAGKIRPVIDDIIDNGHIHVIFDLGWLELLDSSGVGAVVSTFKRTRALGGDTKVACIRGQPKEVFNVLGLGRYIEIYDTVENGLAKFKKIR